MAKRTVKRKRITEDDAVSDTEGSTATGTPSSTPSPAKKSKKNMTAAEKDAAWLEEHKYQQLSNQEILGTFLPRIFQYDLTHACVEKQLDSWSSPVYDHFRTPEIVIVKDVVKYKFVCKRCVYHCFYRSAYN